MASSTTSLPGRATPTQANASGEIFRQIAVVAGFVAVVVGNTVAEAVPINQKTSASISNALPILITPANYAFAIWGLIWIGLAAFALWQALPAQRGNPTMRKITPWFLLSCACNVLWLVSFHYEQFVLSCFIIALLEVSLIAIYLQLGIGRRAVPTVERLATHVPFSLYLGWVTVATIVNIAYTLYWAGVRPDFAIQELATVVMLAIATVIGVIFAWRHKEIALIGVLLWAFTAIGIARQGTTPLTQPTTSPTITTAVWVFDAILVIAVVVSQLNAMRQPKSVVSGRRPLTH